MIRSPIRWVGGKSRLRKAVLALLPPHECYVEPFGGAAWVLLAKKASSVEVLNDVDGELMNFWTVVREQPDAFLAQFELELVSRARFNALAATPPDTLSAVARAHRFYYLVMASWGGELGVARFQISVRDAGHGNRLAGALKTLHARLRPVHARLQTVLLEALDWRDCLARYDRPYASSGVVMYLDPPYPANTCHYAHNMRAWDDHVALVEVLRTLKARFVLSSYDRPEVRALWTGSTAPRWSSRAGCPPPWSTRPGAGTANS